PSLSCRLRCPGCSNWAQSRIRTGTLQMDVSLFENLLRQLQAGEYAVESIEYCGQGEPLLHPQFPEFVRLGHRFFPITP
ncbi:MAG: radical SAM domain-containing protein, partial [Verrucomicrobiota bacterium]